MKKLAFVFFMLLAAGWAFQACDDTKTYAEMLEEEDDAIERFIRNNDIKVISQSEFYAKDSMTDENEYVQMASGVNMNIESKGEEDKTDTVKNNDEILVRFLEYNVLNEDTTLSNITEPRIVDSFRYTVTSTSIAGTFLEGYMLTYYGTAVPAGWLVPLAYVRNMAHVRLIVPSKMGHNTAMQSVIPYYYDIQKYQIW